MGKLNINDKVYINKKCQYAYQGISSNKKMMVGTISYVFERNTITNNIIIMYYVIWKNHYGSVYRREHLRKLNKNKK